MFSFVDKERGIISWLPLFVRVLYQRLGPLIHIGTLCWRVKAQPSCSRISQTHTGLHWASERLVVPVSEAGSDDIYYLAVLCCFIHHQI